MSPPLNMRILRPWSCLHQDIGRNWRMYRDYLQNGRITVRFTNLLESKPWPHQGSRMANA